MEEYSQQLVDLVNGIKEYINMINFHHDSWVRPPVVFVKWNFDAAFNFSSRQVKGGWIVRDHLCIARYWGCVHLGEAFSPLEVEGKALLMAVQNTRFLWFTDVIFEGDCQQLIQHMNDDTRNVGIHNLSYLSLSQIFRH